MIFDEFGYQQRKFFYSREKGLALSGDSIEMKKFLITGAAGFIGSNLSTYLISKGHQVVGFDNLSTGSMTNIERVQAGFPGEFELLVGDIRNPSNLNDALHEVDAVVHLAAQVSVPRSVDEPEENDAINIEGFKNVLTRAAKAGIGQIVYASSCAVYGDSSNLPLNEHETPNPLSPYAESKLENERIAHRFVLDYPGIQIVGMRFFNIFGPWQNFEGGYASVIPRWLYSCLQNQQPEVFGDGSATRDFCFVDDVCAAILSASSPSFDEPHVVFNVGSGKQTSLIDLFNVLVHQTKSTGREFSFAGPRFLDPRYGDIVHSCADVSRAESQLGFSSKVSLAEGIKVISDVQYSSI